MPRAFCTDTAVAGNVLSGVEVASTIRSIDCASTPASARAASAALIAKCEVNSPSAAMCRCRMPGAFADPLVRGIDLGGQFGIGQDPLRQIGAAAEHYRTDRIHETASCAA